MKRYCIYASLRGAPIDETHLGDARTAFDTKAEAESEAEALAQELSEILDEPVLCSVVEISLKLRCE